MATESPVKMLSTLGMGGALGDSMRAPDNSRQDVYYDGYAKELDLLLKDRSRYDVNQREEEEQEEKEKIVHRSGSAPPSVEGSLAAMGGLFSKYATNPSYSGADSNASDSLEAEEQLRSDPAYLSYYYANVNLNPRLPPPLISRENWRLAQRIGAMREKGNVRSMDSRSSRSLFSSQPTLATHKEEPETLMEGGGRQGSAEWTEGGVDGLTRYSPIGLGARRKSIADLIQEEFPSRTPSPAYHLSRPTSRATLDDSDDQRSGLDIALGSSRSSTPNPMNQGNLSTTSGLQRSMSPALDQLASERRLPRVSSSLSTSGTVSAASGLATTLQNLSLPADTKEGTSLETRSRSQQQSRDETEEQSEKTYRSRQMQSQSSQGGEQLNSTQSSVYAQALLQLQQQQLAQAVLNPALQSGMLTPNNVYAAAAAMSYMAGGANNPYYQTSHLTNMYSPQYGIGGTPLPPINPSLIPSMMMMGFPSAGTLPVPLDNTAMAAAIAASRMDARVSSGLGGLDMQQFYRMGIGGGGQTNNTSMQVSPFDPVYIQYLQRIAQEARLASALQDQSAARGGGGYMGGSFADFLGLQKGHSLPGVGLGAYPSSSPLPSPSLPSSPLTHTSPAQSNERSPRLGSSSGSRLTGSGVMGGAMHPKDWSGDSSEEPHASSLLEEFKNNKTKVFELSDIVGKVVEFSADQHGSRFIQQKLEVAKPEEKAFVYQEILPRALTLVTDVFGNYVIQKLFEHGTPQQRRELANQLIGHVLSLTLQMYGCRVIQKAIEVVDIDQQIELVSELDGHVIRCVRDQNGNHVIQKSIECVPQDRIQFIISAFFGQIVALSTHPYGCRVIQRVLEHCTDEATQQSAMDEILPSVCTLSQDQYGNYVVQHILEHGKPHERTTVIKKLAGQVVQMSQHKFASNVVEKCLEFGGHAEHQMLINHILGDTDENEPLQAMMKDQFGNYVVQKVIETCDERQRELVLSRIKAHLHSLKKYTYGKHIVARVEKLVAAGERRSANQSTQKPHFT